MREYNILTIRNSEDKGSRNFSFPCVYSVRPFFKEKIKHFLETKFILLCD